MPFDEHALELSIIELFEKQGYAHIAGSEIHHDKREVLLEDVLRNFLLFKYSSLNLTQNEITTVVNSIKNISSSLYDENKAVLEIIHKGITLRRDDKTQKDVLIHLIDYENPENNFFNIVNQLEIQGREHNRIPDGIVYINGIPLVVLEFKSAIKENTTIEDAYKQLTVRYRRDIPELFKYNAFVVISDGVNNKMGSLFSPYEFFYAWRKVESTDKEVDGINSLITMIEGLFRQDRIISVIKDFEKSELFFENEDFINQMLNSKVKDNILLNVDSKTINQINIKETKECTINSIDKLTLDQLKELLLVIKREYDLVEKEDDDIKGKVYRK